MNCLLDFSLARISALAILIFLGDSLLPLPFIGVVLPADQSHLDAPMDHDPLFSFPEPTIHFSTDVIPLWLLALNRPESELQQLAADTIAIAQGRGMNGLAVTKPDLVELFQETDLVPMVRQAVAKALVAIDAEDAAELLWRQARTGNLDLARVVEPALARWDFAAARPVWLARVKSSNVNRARLLLAIDALATVREHEATDDLFVLTGDTNRWPSVRMAAADALSRIHDTGLVDRARELAAANTADGVNRVLAVTIVKNHRNSAAAELFEELATDSQTPVAARALECLAEIDSQLVLKALPDGISHVDVRIRRTVVGALIEQGDHESVRRLSSILNDRNPSLRQLVARTLIDWAARDDLRAEVLDQTTKMLHSDQWRGIEQASVVMVNLDQKQATDRMFELIDHRRPEVYVTSAWALRRLAVPETLPKLLAIAQRQYQAFCDHTVTESHWPFSEQRVSQLFQAFGQMDYMAADPLLRKYVPKDFSLGNRARAAACWTLGCLYEDKAPPDLSAAMAERLSDLGPLFAESPQVRLTCAISLGRMKSASALPVLRRFSANEGPNSMLGQACEWSIEQITGEPRERPTSKVITTKNWFLTPLP